MSHIFITFRTFSHPTRSSSQFTLNNLRLISTHREKLLTGHRCISSWFDLDRAFYVIMPQKKRSVFNMGEKSHILWRLENVEIAKKCSSSHSTISINLNNEKKIKDFVWNNSLNIKRLKKIYNFRHAFACHRVENTFGILPYQWRI